MNYEMSEHDSDWHGPMSDPNTGGNGLNPPKEVRPPSETIVEYIKEKFGTNSTLEQIQKERRETFNQIPMILGVGEVNRMIVNNFISETARIAYEAGYNNCWHAFEDTDSYQIGLRAGLERAKELVPEDVKNHYGQLAEGYNQLRDKVLSLLDYEIAKHPL